MPHSASPAHLTHLPHCSLAAHEHSSALSSKLQAKHEELERAGAKLAAAEAKEKEHDKAAAAALQAALDAERDKAAAAEAAVAEAHGTALAAAKGEREEALKKAEELEDSLQRLEKERDDALQNIDKLTEERGTLIAAADRAAGLQLAIDDLNNELVRSPALPSVAFSHQCSLWRAGHQRRQQSARWRRACRRSATRRSPLARWQKMRRPLLPRCVVRLHGPPSHARSR